MWRSITNFEDFRGSLAWSGSNYQAYWSVSVHEPLHWGFWCGETRILELRAFRRTRPFQKALQDCICQILRVDPEQLPRERAVVAKP